MQKGYLEVSFIFSLWLLICFYKARNAVSCSVGFPVSRYLSFSLAQVVACESYNRMLCDRRSYFPETVVRTSKAASYFVHTSAVAPGGKGDRNRHSARFCAVTSRSLRTSGVMVGGGRAGRGDPVGEETPMPCCVCGRGGPSPTASTSASRPISSSSGATRPSVVCGGGAWSSMTCSA